MQGVCGFRVMNDAQMEGILFFSRHSNRLSPLRFTVPIKTFTPLVRSTVEMGSAVLNLAAPIEQSVDRSFREDFVGSPLKSLNLRRLRFVDVLSV